MTSPAPTLPQHVWTGWLEEFRQWVTPTTDACEESIYAAGLLALSCAIGRTVSINYAGALYSNLYVTIVGSTSVARKSTVLNRARVVLERAFTDDTLRWARSIGSAEGLLERFCREQEVGVGRNKRVLFGPIPGQRVILDESEFTGIFVKMSRPGTANLLEYLLDLFDGRDFKPPLRSRPMEVREPFFSILSATTPGMLEKRIDEHHITSGLLPRFAFFRVTPREPMCYPVRATLEGRDRLAEGLQRVGAFCQELNESLDLTPDAHRMWEPIYRSFEEEKRVAEELDGVGGVLLKRIDGLAMKVALIYAVMRKHHAIYEEDLHAGVAVASYCANVAKQLSLVAEEMTQDARLVQRITAFMDGEWMMGSPIVLKVGGKSGPERVYRTLDYLVRMGLFEHKKVMIRGCERSMWRKVNENNKGGASG